MATSSDGINWDKVPNPVLLADNNNEYQIVATSINKINGSYYLYYCSRTSQINWRINLAISNDGINWNRYSGNPVLTSTGNWEGNGIYYPSVIEDNGIYRMVYMGSNATTFGFATSSDGLNWTALQSNPFFIIGNTSNHWAETIIAFPNFVRTPGNELRIYYSGVTNNSPIEIGFMRRLP